MTQAITQDNDIFISSQGRLLAGWQVLSPQASCYSSVTMIPTMVPSSSELNAIFWLHVNVNSLDWMRSSLTDLKRLNRQAKVIILANVPEQRDAMIAFELGALGYTHAYHDPEVLRQVRQVVQFGGVWLGQEILLQLIHEGRKLSERSSEAITDTLARLTPREREVAIRAAQGMSNKEIARELSITERTVKAHLTAVFERVGVADRLQLAIRINERLSS